MNAERTELIRGRIKLVLARIEETLPPAPLSNPARIRCGKVENAVSRLVTAVKSGERQLIPSLVVETLTEVILLDIEELEAGDSGASHYEARIRKLRGALEKCRAYFWGDRRADLTGCREAIKAVLGDPSEQEESSAGNPA